MGYLLGVDVGTSTTVAAVLRPGGSAPEPVTLGDGAAVAPSAVYAAPDGTLLCGEAAEQRAATEPERVVREFVHAVGDPAPLVVGEQSFAPEQLTALLVEHAAAVAARAEGGPPDRIAVTRPAAWGPHEQDLLTGALAERGITATVVAGAQAAAVQLAATEGVEPGAAVAVLDLGGGTAEAAVVRREADGALPFTPAGHAEDAPGCGGLDADLTLVEHVRATVPQAFEGFDEADPAARAALDRLRQDCRAAREALSTAAEVTVPVRLGEVRATLPLERTEFEELIRPRVEEAVATLREVIASSGTAPVVLLVGGFSRTPLVGRTVEELGHPVRTVAEPDRAACLGAVLALCHTDDTEALALPGPVVPGAAGPAAAGLGAAAAGAGETPGTGVPSAAGPSATGRSGPDSAALAADPGPLPWEGAPVTDRMASGPSPAAVHDGAFADPPTAPLPAVAPPHGYPGAGPGTAAYGTEYLGPDGATAVTTEPSVLRRYPALLVVGGGLVAAVAVLGVVLLWPQDHGAGNATPELPALPAGTTEVSAPVTTAEETEEPVQETTETTRAETSVPRTTSEVAPPPPPPATTPPPVTTPPPSPSSEPSATPTTSVEEPPLTEEPGEQDPGGPDQP